MRTTRFGVLLSFLVMIGCSSSSNLGTPAGNNTASSPSGDAPGSACDQYLQCVAAAAPSALPVALQAYGPSGSCWGGSATIAADCESACKTSMGQVPGGNAFKSVCGPQDELGDGTVTGPSNSSDGGATFAGTGSTGSGGATGETCDNACADKFCATELDDCSTSTDCSDTFTCVGNCKNPNDPNCESTCMPADISSIDKSNADALFTCLQNSCGGACDPY